MGDFEHDKKKEIESINRLYVRFIPTLFPKGLEWLPPFDARGDALYEGNRIEFKSANSYKSEFWLEEWSNFFNRRRGWSHTCCADYVIFHAMRAKKVIIFDWPRLKEWYLANGQKYCKVTNIDIGRTRQHNHTIWRRIPFSHIEQFILAECYE